MAARHAGRAALPPSRTLYSRGVTLVLLVRHGLTAGTGRVLTGRAPGVSLDDRGREQATALAARLAAVPLDAIVSSPLERCQETAAAIAAARAPQGALSGPSAGAGGPLAVQRDERLVEVSYGDWTGRPLAELMKEPLWRIVQAHPSAARFPGADGEDMAAMAHRAVAAIRSWNELLGPRSAYLVCSHGDVIKAIVADALGMHLDMYQRIQVDPCSLTAIRYTGTRPFVTMLNATVPDTECLARSAGAERAPEEEGVPGSDAVVGGGAGAAALAGQPVPPVTGAGAGEHDAVVAGRGAGE